jgi:hypothetical protein
MGRCKLKKNAVPKIKKHVTLGSDQILHPINDQILPSPIPVPHEEKVVSCGVLCRPKNFGRHCLSIQKNIL